MNNSPLARKIGGKLWAWCHDGCDPNGYIELMSDGTASAWGLSRWRVTNEILREVTVDDIGGAGQHKLYFNESATGYICSHSAQRGFDPYQFKSPDQAGAPTTWPKLQKTVEKRVSSRDVISALPKDALSGRFGSRIIDFEGTATIRWLAMQCGPIAYAKGSEILKLARETTGPVPCRQVLEATSSGFFHTAEDVQNAFLGNNVLSISYAWAVRGGGHPDPDGFHMKRLQVIIENYMAHADGRDPAVFLDWFSLYQHHCPELPRTDQQSKLFDVGLRHMHVNYGHKGARVVLLTDLPTGRDLTGYYHRGWPLFERSCAACGANWVMPFTMSDNDVSHLRRAGGAGRNILFDFRGRREPPVLPDDFAAALDSKTLTVESDRDVIRELYRECFETIAAAARKLAFCNIGADDAWLGRLCRALPAYRRLEAIDLSGSHNRVGDAGGRALAAAMRALPGLQMVSLLDTQLSPQAQTVLAAACAGRRLLIGPGGP